MKSFLEPKEVLHLKELGVEFENTECVWIDPLGSTCICSPKLYKPKPHTLVHRNSLGDIDYHTNSGVTSAPSLQEVLEKLPKILFFKTFSSYLVILWENTVTCEMGYTGIKSSKFKNTNPLQAAYELLCWCAKNNYKTKEVGV